MSNTDTTAVTAYPEFDSEPALPPSLPAPTSPPADVPRRAARGTMPPLPGQLPAAASASAGAMPDSTRADARTPDDVQRLFTEDPHEVHTVPAPLVDADELGLEMLSEDDLEEIIEDDDDDDNDGAVEFDIVVASGPDDAAVSARPVSEPFVEPEEPAVAEPAPAPAPAGATDRAAALLIDFPDAEPTRANDVPQAHDGLRRPERSFEHLEPSTDSIEAADFVASMAKAVAPVADVVGRDDALVVVREAEDVREQLTAGEVETDAHLPGPGELPAIPAPFAHAAAPAPTVEAVVAEALAPSAPRRITEQDGEPAHAPATRRRRDAEDPLLRSTVRPSQRAPSLEDLARVQNSIATLLPDGPAAEPAPLPERRWLTSSESSRKEPLVAGAIVGAVALVIAGFLLLSGSSDGDAPTPAAVADNAAADNAVADDAVADDAEAGETAPAALATAPLEEGAERDSTAPAADSEAVLAPPGPDDATGDDADADDAATADATATDAIAAAATDATDGDDGDDGDDGEEAVADADTTVLEAPAAGNVASRAPVTDAAAPTRRVVSTPLAEPPAVAPPADSGPVRAVLASEPAGAVVTLLEGGKATVLGPSPVEVELDRSSRYEAIFTLDGYRSVVSQVALGSNDAVEIRVNFRDRNTAE